MNTTGRIKVWDALVRIFHWGLAGAFFSAYLIEDRLLDLHVLLGYGVLGLLAVRVVWGLIGSRHARFTDFVHHPAVVLGYLRDVLRLRARRYIGHNPAGGAMVIALLVSLLMTAGSGVALYGAIEFSGPLAALSQLSDGTASLIEDAHGLFADLTLALVGLHVAGVLLASLQHRENLVRAMVTGYKAAEQAHDFLEPRSGNVVLANMREVTIMKTKIIVGVTALLLLSGAGLVFGSSKDDGGKDGGKDGGRYTSSLDVAPVTDPAYNKECGSCHFAYQPGLLPARSWEKLMGSLDEHFGENAELADEDRKALTDFLVRNAAETANYKRSVKIMQSLKPDAAPLRISETPYFTRKHRELKKNMVEDNPKVRSIARCEVCHQRAAEGSYAEREILIPGYGRWED